MRLLLDTHVFLWWLADDERLTVHGRELIADPGHLVHVSAASIWEASIKQALGRLDVDPDLDLAPLVASEGFTELPVSAAHAWRAGRLPMHHADPFDRMLVAQASLEDLTLLTADRAVVQAYDVDALRL